ncbi:MAG TPA: hypothetical protein VIS54_00385 [Psychromonas sp.]
MSNIYDLSILPNQHAINSVADLHDDFIADCADFEMLLSRLKLNIVSSGDLLTQDYQRWFFTRGMDYFYNPKLFVYAPLNCTWVFLSELFKLYKIDYISKNVPKMVIKCVLLRLSDFKHPQFVS